MKAEIFPTSILVILLMEFLFGIGYNVLVAWAHEHKIMHVSTSVVVGVSVTVLMPVTAFFDRDLKFWQAGLLLMGCFTASGIPMIIGSAHRTVTEKDNKKRHAWPTAARHARDDAVMDLSALADEIAERARAGKLTVQDLPSYVHKLHQVIGMLKSV